VPLAKYEAERVLRCDLQDALEAYYQILPSPMLEVLLEKCREHDAEK
jgi:hypothetical protein